MGRLYDTPRWKRERAAFLASHPLCAYCDRVGRTRKARVVDHVRPHRGNEALFWDRGNWQPLCKPCHDSVKQSAEKGGSGIIPGCDVNGMPLDSRHAFVRGQADHEGRGGSKV